MYGLKVQTFEQNMQLAHMLNSNSEHFENQFRTWVEIFGGYHLQLRIWRAFRFPHPTDY